jgi:hypothetical protein
MARSYFSRIVTPSPTTALQPPRPITSLWKAARLERLAGVNVNAREAGLGFADAGESRAGRQARLAEQKAEGEAVAVPRLEPLSSSNRTIEIEQKDIQFTQSKTATAKAEEQESRREQPGKSSRGIEEAAPLPARRDRELEITANAVADREMISPIPVPAPLSLRNNSGIDAERRTTAEKNSSLHIGKIEVQIAPPPRSSSRPAPSPKPGRLARGYALWTNWQQR